MNNLQSSSRASRAQLLAISILVIAGSLATSVCLASTIVSGVFTGTIRDAAGGPIAGSAVTATHRTFARATTVFTDADGRFRIPPLEAGEYDIRIRRAGYKDLEQTDLALGDGTTRLDLRLDPETDPRELAWQLPASRWMPLVLSRLSSDAHREEFTRQCGYCHQQGSWATRVQRSKEDWEAIFVRMGRMGGTISPALRAELPDALNAAWADDNYLKALTEPRFVPPPPPDKNAGTVVITEWRMGLATSVLHDLVVYPDGSIYAVDTANDLLFRLDPRTGERRQWAVPPGDSPPGGVFAGTGTLQTPGAVTRVGPHSLQVAPDGAIWMTLCLGNKVARFEPKTAHWTIYVQRDGGLYPHTLRFDHKGRVWYTLAVSNGVGMIDPKTGEQRTYRLPAPTFGQALSIRALPLLLKTAQYLPVSAGAGEGATLPVPYGIDIAPDGGVWFSQLNAHRIGHLDPDSGAIQIIDTPFAGPRRLRFDSKGNLWIPGFSSDLLARFSPATGKFKTWKLPTPGVETPYALNVDRRTDIVWICGTASDTMMSFDPRSEKFTIYPMPTRVTYTREIDFDQQGNIWTSNSNVPAWQIEAPSPEFIRLELGAADR